MLLNFQMSSPLVPVDRFTSYLARNRASDLNFLATPRTEVAKDAKDSKQDAKEDAKKMENMMLGGTAVTIAAILAILLPLLSQQ